MSSTMDTLTCMHVDGQLFLPLLAQNLMKQAKTCKAKLPWAYLHLVVSSIPITYQVFCIDLALEVRCGVKSRRSTVAWNKMNN